MSICLAVVHRKQEVTITIKLKKSKEAAAMAC